MKVFLFLGAETEKDVKEPIIEPEKIEELEDNNLMPKTRRKRKAAKKEISYDENDELLDDAFGMVS